MLDGTKADYNKELDLIYYFKHTHIFMVYLTSKIENENNVTAWNWCLLRRIYFAVFRFKNQFVYIWKFPTWTSWNWRSCNKRHPRNGDTKNTMFYVSSTRREAPCRAACVLCPVCIKAGATATTNDARPAFQYTFSNVKIFLAGLVQS